MMQILDFKRRFQRLGVTPFATVPVADLPFTQYGLEWCARCNLEVDADSLAVNKGTLYLWKRRCKRCGKVLKRGIYDKSGGPIPRIAYEWVADPGQDRSK